MRRVFAMMALLASPAAGQGVVPSTDTAIDADPRPAIALTLDDAVALALKHNVSIAAERLTPQMFEPRLQALRAAYQPTVTSVVSTQSTVTPPTSSIVGVPQGAAGVALGTTTFNAGWTQWLPKGGGQLAATLNNSRGTSTSTTTLFNPIYNATYGALYNQPLLRGRSIDATRHDILAEKISHEVSELDLRETMLDILSSVRKAYWSLAYADAVVDVAERSVSLAVQLVQNHQARVAAGTLAPIDVLSAQAQEALARQVFVEAVGSRETAELALKQLIVTGTEDPYWGLRLDPVDELVFRATTVDTDAAIRLAVNHRTDAQAMRKALESNLVTQRFLRNQRLPQVDAQARYGLAGIGGTEFIRLISAIDAPVVATIPGGFSDALNAILHHRYPAWSVQVNVSMPLGENAAAASLAATRIEHSQTVARVKALELNIAAEIARAAIGVRNGAQAVAAAQAAETLAQRAYDAERNKFSVGLSTTYDVILQLVSLHRARTAHLEAVLRHRSAVIDFDRLQQAPSR